MNERSAGEAFCKSRVALFADAASPFQVVNRRRLPLPADVAAFAAVAEPSERALRQLGSLLTPGESVWLIGENYPRISELASTDTLPCLQMALAAPVAALAADLAIEPLNEANAAEMVALTALAFPGFFRRRTCEMVRTMVCVATAN